MPEGIGYSDAALAERPANQLSAQVRRTRRGAA